MQQAVSWLFQQAEIAGLAICRRHTTDAVQPNGSTGYQGIQPGVVHSPACSQGCTTVTPMDMMPQLQELLTSWHSRTASRDEQPFTDEARQRIATLFLEMACSPSLPDTGGNEPKDVDQYSTQLAQLGIDEAVDDFVFRSELRNCQLSLLEILALSASDAAAQHTAGDQKAGVQTFLQLLQNLDELITRSADKLADAGETRSDTQSSPDTDGRQRKTLQHEIRTPLQGALLTTELMLEDAGHGDPVSADDILAVRKSIETAVGILNDFATNSSAG